MKKTYKVIKGKVIGDKTAKILKEKQEIQKLKLQSIADKAYKLIKQNSAKYPADDYSVSVELLSDGKYEITVHELKEQVSPLSYWTYSGQYGG